MEAIITYKCPNCDAGLLFDAEKQVFKKAGEEIGKIELQYRKYGIIGPKKNITAPIIATEDILYYKNNINDGHVKIEYNNENKSAWKLANKNVKLNFTLPNYSSEVNGKINLNKFDLFKIYASSSIIFIIKILVVLVIIAYSIRLINLRRKRMKRKKRNNKKRR